MSLGEYPGVFKGRCRDPYRSVGSWTVRTSTTSYDVCRYTMIYLALRTATQWDHFAVQSPGAYRIEVCPPGRPSNKPKSPTASSNLPQGGGDATGVKQRYDSHRCPKVVASRAITTSMRVP